MRPSLPVAVLVATAVVVHAFVPVRRQVTLQSSSSSKSKLSTNLSSSFITSFFPPNPSSASTTEAAPPRPPNRPPPFNLEPETVFGRCRAIIANDLCILEPSLLSEEFVCIGPYMEPLNKEEYIAAGKFFDLRKTFPDLDYRAHDFRIIEQPDLKKSTVTVRCTLRTVGTMRRELRLRNQVLPPNGKRMVCPPEALTLRLDASSGLVVQMCSGFVMDRLVGNTAGLCGVMAAATFAGAAPSEWEIYPPTVVISRFFGRTVQQLPLEPSSFLAPFPETVMIQLAKGLLANDYGFKDASLLGKDFSYCTPIRGPMGKDSFLQMMGKFNPNELFPNLLEEFTNFRVDPFDPYRVWIDLRAKGKTVDGTKYEGPSEAVSLTFDDDGYCTRITAGAVIDPTEGNTGGLGGTPGMQYSMGQFTPLTTRPLPQILSRTQKAILKPFTGKDVDDYTPTRKIVEPVPSVKEETLEQKDQKVVATKSSSTVPKEAPVLSLKKSSVLPKEESASKNSSIKQTMQPIAPKQVDRAKAKTDSIKNVPAKVALSKKVEIVPTPKASATPKQVDRAKVKTDSVKNAPAKFALSKKVEIAPSPKASATLIKAIQKTSKAPEIKKASVKPLIGKVTSAPTKGSVAVSSQKMLKGAKELEVKKSQSLSLPQFLKRSSPEQLAVKKSTKLSTSADKVGGEKNTSNTVVKKAIIVPSKGVPVMKQWKKGTDGSISGSIYGSKAFKDGDSVTTSAVASGLIEKGSIVTTVRGSKYLLA